MDYKVQLLEWAFYLLMSGIGMYVARSMNEMNSKLAVLLEKSVWHEKEVDETKDRVTKLEQMYLKHKLN